jgi:hypothetical protein
MTRGRGSAAWRVFRFDVIEQAFVMCRGRIIELHHFPTEPLPIESGDENTHEDQISLRTADCFPQNQT